MRTTDMIVAQSNSPPRERFNLLSRLYDEQAALGDTAYLREHASAGALTHHVNVFEWYAPRLEGRRSVLDWGCHHGPDSCMLRHKFGDALDLEACDFAAESDFPVFRDYARPRYTQLTDPLTLPYPAARFDAVVGSGVLEHTAMDGEALKEVYRVLRPHGLFVVTYLPSAHSRDERQRRERKVDYHRRLYTHQTFENLLLSHGFEPLEILYQGYVPNRLRSRPRPLWWNLLRSALHRLEDSVWKPVLQPLLYPYYTQSVLCGVARKMTCM